MSKTKSGDHSENQPAIRSNGPRIKPKQTNGRAGKSKPGRFSESRPTHSGKPKKTSTLSVVEHLSELRKFIHRRVSICTTDEAKRELLVVNASIWDVMVDLEYAESVDDLK